MTDNTGTCLDRMQKCSVSIKMRHRIAALENVPIGRCRCLIRNVAKDRGAGRSKPLAKRASQRAVASERLAVTRGLRQCWHSSGEHSGCCGSHDKVLRSLSLYLLQP